MLTADQSFATGLKEKSTGLCKSVENAIVSHERELESTLQGSEIVSDVIDRDPAKRIGITLTEQQKMFLISRGPFQPVLQTYPVKKKFLLKSRIPLAPIGSKNSLTLSIAHPLAVFTVLLAPYLVTIHPAQKRTGILKGSINGIK